MNVGKEEWLLVFLKFLVRRDIVFVRVGSGGWIRNLGGVSVGSRGCYGFVGFFFGVRVWFFSTYFSGIIFCEFRGLFRFGKREINVFYVSDIRFYGVLMTLSFFSLGRVS